MSFFYVHLGKNIIIAIHRALLLNHMKSLIYYVYEYSIPIVF